MIVTAGKTILAGITGLWIKDMMIDGSILFKISLISPGSDNGLVFDLNGSKRDPAFGKGSWIPMLKAEPSGFPPIV